MLNFNHDAMRWSWDLDRIHAKAYTDNVVDFMVGKLGRLLPDTRNALQLLACLGNSAEVAKLSIVLEGSDEQVHASLGSAVHQELVERLGGAYRFAHDRVQEAAYSLIPDELRPAVHLRIGRLLVARIPPDKQEEAIFDIVNHLDRGASLITSRHERVQLAELNLRAGKRAKVSAAYSSALTYLVAGATLLDDDSWQRCHELIFEVELLRAECEFLTGAMVAADERLKALASRAGTPLERASIACLHIDLHITVAQSRRALAIGLDYLRHLGIKWSLSPTDNDVRREYDRIWSQLGTRSIEDLIDLPVMTDPASLATMDVLTKMAPATFTLMETNLHALVVCWAANLGLDRGNSDGSCDVYVRLGYVACDQFGDYRSGSRFGQVGYELVERRGLRRFQARTYMLFANSLIPYTQHIKTARDLLRRGFDAANKTGDLMFVMWYRGVYLIENLLASGDPLGDVQREAERALAFAQKERLAHIVHIVQTYIELVQVLRGLTRKFISFGEDDLEGRFTGSSHSTVAEWLCSIKKAQAHFHTGEYALAIEAAAKAQRHRASGYINQVADSRFYSALSHAAVFDGADSKESHFAALSADHRQLQIWARQCPANFESRAALVGAEMARVEGRDGDAVRLYELAIRSARDNGFVHYEAIAYERASAFLRVRGADELADFYLRKCRDRYFHWGALGKVKQLEEIYPQLGNREVPSAPTSTITAPIEHLDLAPVIKVSRAISSEIVPERLIDTLMRTAIAQAGAVRGLLISSRTAELRLEAEANTTGETTTVHLRDDAVTETAVPLSVLRWVLHTQESLILNDACAEDPFSADPYMRLQRARSILCLPLINKSKLIGILYLENNLAPRVFPPARIAVLKVLASQAAISLENSRLYGDLQERETKIRRLVDASIIGIFVWRIEGRIIEANETFLRLVGYDREDLASGRMHREKLTPPEWRSRDEQAMKDLKDAGTVQPFEKEYCRKDGTRVPVLIAWARLMEDGNEVVGFVLDLTERKRAEEALRELEADLARMNRLSMTGVLAASLAHEITQPIGAARNNVRAAMNFLGRHPPDLSETREALDCVVGDIDRAGKIIDRIRDQIKKAPPRKALFDLNETIDEVLTLARSAIIKNGISVQTCFAEKRLAVHGDRVQLQQVVLNLILNAIEAMSLVEAGMRMLSISTKQTNSVGVAVGDSGPGIDPDDRERVFEAFYTTKSSGVGMGLSICRSIIDAHGGQLWAEANEPRGAVFQFTLPGAARGPHESSSGPRVA
jgi:PAS domain S-box-containing protein